jgi:hypothetical protein
MSDTFTLEEFQDFLPGQLTESVEETAVVIKSIYQKLSDEISSRPPVFYFALVPAAIIPIVTRFLPPTVKVYTDIVLISVYTNVVFEIAR